MSNCQKCFWADRDPKTHRQEIHMEPDVFSPHTKPGQDPPEVRVVQSCGAGAGYYKKFGAQEHNCRLFEDESEAKAEEAEDVQEKRKAWKHPTKRLQLPSTKNALVVIQQMALQNDDAYTILLDLMAYHPDELADTITHLDDMNMRGGQVVAAFNYYDKNLDTLVSEVPKRDPSLVAYVNSHYKLAKTERAVERGAHLYGHKPAKTKAAK